MQFAEYRDRTNMSEIREFFAGRNVFITGGTGFIGKGLVEKLLRSCREIGTIYLLVRDKKGKTAQERVDSMIVEPVFDILRTSSPDFSRKIVAVSGDAASEKLGLSAADLQRIVDEVSVIFHVAATVNFAERLDKAISLNVNGVKSVLEIAKACKNLATKGVYIQQQNSGSYSNKKEECHRIHVRAFRQQHGIREIISTLKRCFSDGRVLRWMPSGGFLVGVHVSTAFSNCVLGSIEEKLYAPPLSHKEANDLCDNLKIGEKTKDVMKSITKSDLKGWPNTYTFTKAIGEGVVAEFAGELPFAVFRPPIVINSYNEPMPGWISGFIGLPAMLCAIMLGVNHALLLDANMKMDMVPVDYACNALISAAWETAVTKRRHRDDIPVYNYINGNEKPITWGQFHRNSARSIRQNPAVDMIYYPFVVVMKSKFVCVVVELFLHILPALIIDNAARLLGKQTRMYEVAIKIWKAWSVFEYFTTRQWDFKNHRVQNLWERIGPADRREFPFSMQNIDWKVHSNRMIEGFKKYLVKETPGNEDKAKRLQFHLYIIHLMVRLAFYSFVLWILWKIFS